MYKFKLTIPAQEIPEELKIGDSVIYQGNGEVETVVTKTNHDGTETKTAVITPILTEVKRSDSPVTAPPLFKDAVKHKSLSQKVRDKLWVLHQKLGITDDFEVFYEAFQTKTLEKIDQEIAEADFEGLL